MLMAGEPCPYTFLGVAVGREPSAFAVAKDGVAAHQSHRRPRLSRHPNHPCQNPIEQI